MATLQHYAENETKSTLPSMSNVNHNKAFVWSAHSESDFMEENSFERLLRNTKDFFLY